jgi:tRNA pseudouridine38-40 synthase
MRYFAHISYLGTNYSGWQRQPRHMSVQQTMEEAFATLLKKKIFCLGCGRTDSGVHASQFFFHFDIQDDLPSRFVFKINKMLPDDIALHDVFPVEENQHAQFGAVERTYEYFVHTFKNPYLSSISSLYLFDNMKFKEMQQAANLLTQYTDYSLFCKCPIHIDNMYCKVKSAQLYRNQASTRFLFRITADRFITAMIRIIVYRLLDIGIGKMSVADFEGILTGQITSVATRLAYPQGLHLAKVTYPFLNLPTENSSIPRENDFFWEKV